MPAPFSVIAAGKVTGADGASSKTAGATTARTAAGVYTLTLSQEVDATEATVLVTPVRATFASATVEHTSDSVKTIRTWDAAGAALDADFNFVVAQHSFAA